MVGDSVVRIVQIDVYIGVEQREQDLIVGELGLRLGIERRGVAEDYDDFLCVCPPVEAHSRHERRIHRLFIVPAVSEVEGVYRGRYIGVIA